MYLDHRLVSSGYSVLFLSLSRYRQGIHYLQMNIFNDIFRKYMHSARARKLCAHFKQDNILLFEPSGYRN